jgi:Tfp pilus assembly protein PilF
MDKRTTKKAPAVNWKWLLLLIFITGLVPLLVYANTLSFGLVFNDPVTFKQVFNYSMGGPEAYLRPFMQPYVRSSFFDDIAHYKSTFGWYHLVNVWIHMGAAVALALLTFVVARRTASDESANVAPYTVAGLAGLIYGCHPLAAQSASYISARWASLGASNFLVALLFFSFIPFSQGAIRVWAIVATVIYSGMCITSSETGLVLVPSMVALFYLLKPASKSAKDWAFDRPIITALTGVFTVVVPVLLLAGSAPAAAPNYFGMTPLSATAYYATQAKAFLTYYTRTFFVPFGLSVDPPYAHASGFGDILAIGGIILFAGCIYAMYRWRAHKLLFLGLWLTVAGYLPHCLIQQQDAVSDPAFYLSLGGLSLVAAWSLAEIWRGAFKSEAPKMVAVVVVLAILAVVQNLNFKDNAALVSSILATNQRSVLADCLSAQQKLNSGDAAGAIKEADDAISIDPASARGYYIRGLAQLRMHEDSEAKNSFEKAQDRATKQRLELLADIKYGLAEAYLNMDKTDKATEVAKEGFSLDPYAARAKYIMGLIALKQRNYNMAMGYLEQALQQGVADARLPGARVLLGLQQWNAAQQLASSLAATGNSPEVQLILGNAALAQGDLKTAEPALTAALKANSHNAEAMALLSILYQKKGDKAVAESYHKDAVALDPQVFTKLLMPAAAPLPKSAKPAQAQM